MHVVRTRTNLTRLAVVIPALNESRSIDQVVAAVPRDVLPLKQVEVIVIDDGSTDDTELRAVTAGADAIVRHTRPRGLSVSFNAGIRTALKRGADIIVQLDGDGQHDPADIPRMIAPLVDGSADVSIGVRAFDRGQPGDVRRRAGNRIGSMMLGRALRMEIGDFTSGYRAYTREAALQLHVVYKHTYTVETLVQAASKRLEVAEVPITVRDREFGESRMTHSLVRYIARSAAQAGRTILHDNPLSVFLRMAGVAGIAAAAMVLWFLVSYAEGGMHLPLLLGSVILVLVSGGLAVCAMLADGISANRRLLEDVMEHVKSMDFRTPVGEQLVPVAPAETPDPSPDRL